MIQLFKAPSVEVPFSYGKRDVLYNNGIAKDGVSRSELLKSYKTWVFTCVTIRAEAQMRAQFVIGKTDRKGQVVPVDRMHPAQFLLDNPNPFMSSAYFKFLVSAYLDLCGECYAYIARDRLNVPRQLWLLPPDKMKVIPGNNAERMIDKYVLDWNAGPSSVYTFEQEEILHLKQPNPNSPFYGVGATEAAAYIIDVNMGQKRWFKNFYDKDATPSLVLKFKNRVENQTAEEFLQKWIYHFGGSEKKRRIALLDNGGEVQTIDTTPQEMQFNESQLAVRNEIFAMYRVPLSKAGLNENIMARATAETMNYTFYSDVIEPRTILIEDQITLDLLRIWFGDDLICKHKNLIPEDSERIAKIDQIEISTGIRTINEIRARNQAPALPGGDEPLVPITVQPLSQAGKNGTQPKQ